MKVCDVSKSERALKTFNFGDGWWWQTKLLTKATDEKGRACLEKGGNETGWSVG